MKKVFQRIGLGVLVCLSFIYTEKASYIIIDNDDIMKKIKEEKKCCELKPVNAIIEGNTIIPGIKGKEVNELASYHKLKKLGEFNQRLLEYKETTPNISVENNYNKYIISGNKSKREISLIFKVTGNDDINNILNKLNNKNIKVNFFIDSIWLENNNELFLSIINDGHIIGNLSYNLNYNHSDFIWINTTIKKLGNQNQNYCYNEDEDPITLKICSINKSYTVRPTLINSKYPALETKDKLKNGLILSYSINNILDDELDHIINSIYNKGLKIVTLPELLKE